MIFPSPMALIFLFVIQIPIFATSCLSEGMEYPIGVVASPDGSLFVADRNLPGIWKMDQGKPTIYFQGSKKFRTPLNAVRCLAMDAKGVLYAGDSATREVYRFDESGQPQPLTSGGIGIPMAMSFDSKGNLFVADLELHCIYQIPSGGGPVTEYAKVQAPRGIAVDGQDRVWVLSSSKQPVIRFDENRKSEVIVGEPVFEFANQMAVDSKGNAYVCDGYAKAVWKIPVGGKPEKMVSGDPLNNPVGLAVVQDRLLIADPRQKNVFSLPLEGDKTLQSVLK
ncbi:MAG: NHL repeat-containing protein [Planctomycetota bacterium]|nr:NHL repeat-containing protein [Planctomycetota bacterium]